ncbi:MAG: dTDP-glucose 4,6-dehydratase [Desulfobacteraceae bacterium]
MENLLVTGGSGFIGSNFIRYVLGETGFQGCIINVDKLTYAGNPESLADIARDCRDRYVFEHCDICDRAALDSVFEHYGIDTVCHFAAESHVDRSISSPEVFIDTNVKGTFNLLEAARKRGGAFHRFHHVSTDEVYGSLGKTGFFTEHTAYSPNSPYSASKAASDHLVRAYYKTYGLDVSISNCSNNYGPFQFPEKLIPLMILNIIDAKPLPIYGDGANVRDWLYVRDHCRAVWLIMNKAKPGSTYNVGGGCELENRVIVEKICSIIDRTDKKPAGMKSAKELITYIKDRPGHDFRYAIDCTKLKNELGFQAEESFESGLEKTIAWYFNHLDWVARIKSGEYLKWMETHYQI